MNNIPMNHFEASPSAIAVAQPDVSSSVADRAAGAVMGALIGDALGVGPHWYYDLNDLRKDFGPWIEGYTDPKPGRYHAGLKAGMLSQAGIILTMLLKSVVERGGYDEQDFCRRMDDELFPRLDGTPRNGPGGYTSQSIREAWARRVKEKKPWGQLGGHADNTEAIERTLVLAARYALDPWRAAQTVSSNCALTQIDGTVAAMTTAFAAVLALLVQGEKLDEQLSDKLLDLVRAKKLPFHGVTAERLQPPKPGVPESSLAGRFASPDALLMPSYMAEAAQDGGIAIEPAWKVSLVYGMPCAIYFQVPAAYYLAARFKSDFECAVLHAINGGGQNQARAILTGALVGAQVGLSRIPQRFLDGLKDGSELVTLATELGEAAAKE
jgi:ADP-ribosylglycohydrolase